MIRKGDIYSVYLKSEKGSHLQGGIRPVMVVSGREKNKGSIVNIVPLTTAIKKRYLYTHIIFKGYGLNQTSMTLCEQAMPIDKSRLKPENYIGTVTDTELLDKITKANQMQFA